MKTKFLINEYRLPFFSICTFAGGKYRRKYQGSTYYYSENYAARIDKFPALVSALQRTAR